MFHCQQEIILFQNNKKQMFVFSTEYFIGLRVHGEMQIKLHILEECSYVKNGEWIYRATTKQLSTITFLSEL